MKSIILAGGSGTRLFPMSRKKFPKQFIRFGLDETFFQKTTRRILKVVNDLSDFIVIANADYQFYVKNQLREILHKPADTFNIILEPVGRNTAPAIALAVKYLTEKLNVADDEVIFISPSDHEIYPDVKFVEYVKNAELLAKHGFIVTFGVLPFKPETGYGYIEGDMKEKTLGCGYRVKRFHEKPDYATAQNYVSAGNYYWNSGMFAFTIKTILNEFKKYASEIFEMLTTYSYDDINRRFEAMPAISIDYAIMEKTDNAVVLPMEITWSDVGSWDSVYEVMDKDKHFNVKLGNVVDIDTKDSLILGGDRMIAAIDVENLIIVDTQDATLVAKKGEGQKIKELVDRCRNIPSLKHITEFHPTVYRPWGNYTDLEQSDRYRIKKIVVEPDQALSLQLHYHRSEHWIVVKGTAKVILENESGNLNEYFIHENESIYVPKAKKHRLINPGKISLEIIEIQVGEYVGEDDIVRFEDIYNRI